MLLVNAGRLTVGVSGIVVGIEDLSLVTPLKEHTAVAAILSVAPDLRWSPPLNVKLAVAECTLGIEVAGDFDDGEGSFGDRPGRRAAVSELPLRGIFAADSTIASEGGAGPGPGVTTRGTGSHTSVSFGSPWGC